MSPYKTNKTFATLFGFFILNLLLPNTYGQGLGNSPYTVLGVGEPYSDAFSSNLASGGAGVSSSNGIHINNLNPALWVRNRYTTYEFGAIGQYKQISSPTAQQRDFGANIGYLALSLPAAPKWSVGISLKPYSFVDFESRTNGKVPGTIYNTYYYYSGKGAINKVSLTNAILLGKYISLGLEASYLFGNVRRASESQLLIGDGRDYLVSRAERNSYRDFAFRAGTAVKIPLKKNNKLNLNLGGTYSFGTDLNARQTTSFESSLNSYPVGVADTLSNNTKGGIRLPSQYRVGASLEWPYKLTLAVDYEKQNWSEYRSFANSNDGLTDAGRLHMGLEYIPKITSTRYFNLVEYRLGFSHGQMPYNPAGLDLKDSNLSLGASFPIGRGGNSFTLALVGGQRGVLSTQSIKERYGRVVLGLTLVDASWFQKQKID
jgi:hypothetical protein